MQKTALKPDTDTFELVVTINGENSDETLLRTLRDSGATLFRVNGAFSDLDSVRTHIHRIRLALGKSSKILLDLPGYKVRFLNLKDELEFEKGAPFFVQKSVLNYPEVIEVLDVHTFLRINDGKNRLEIIGIDPDGFTCVADSSGTIKPGKGLHFQNVSFRPSSVSISDRDRALIGIAKEIQIDFVGLSFVYDANDIAYVKSLLKGSRTRILPKIESKESITNLKGILASSDVFLLDRGDLAGEIGVEHIWHVQKHVIKWCKLLNRKIIIATQVMSSMVHNPLPTIAEIDDLFSLFSQGADGIQLSEETSVGKYPVDAVRSLIRMKRHHVQRLIPKMETGPVFWLLGPTSAGKTTVGRELVRTINHHGGRGVHLDGDEVRNMFPRDHGFSENARLAVVQNLALLANKLAEAGMTVVVSALTAHDRARDYIRTHIENLRLIFIDCPIETCIQRDDKGLYRKALAGEIDTLIGINSPYQPPDHFELRVETEQMPPESAAMQILAHFFDPVAGEASFNSQE